MLNISYELEIIIDEREKRYPIYIGNNILKFLPDILDKIKYNKIMIVSDENVYKLYADKISKILSDANLEYYFHIIPAGEESKSYKFLKKGYEALLNKSFARDGLIISLGGGVPGDLAGYLAASFMRGIKYIQIPTTLLAQVDSSIGGKTAINLLEGKNLVGSFYQPEVVLIDIKFLETLNVREFKTGMAEVIKYGIIFDEDFFEYLSLNRNAIMKLSKEELLHIIKRSCEIKAEIVSEDEKESGIRAILNFGHTLAHGLEAITAYKKYTHGEAVAIGMVAASLLSYKLSILSEEKVNLIRNIISEYNLPGEFAEDTNKIYEYLKNDKKVKDGKIRWILLNDIGKTIIKSDLDKKLILNVMEELKC